MSYHGIQLTGIGLVIASLAIGNTLPEGNGAIYFPNPLLAIFGVLVTFLGAFGDPIIDRNLSQGRDVQPKS